MTISGGDSGMTPRTGVVIIQKSIPIDRVPFFSILTDEVLSERLRSGYRKPAEQHAIKQIARRRADGSELALDASGCM